MLLISVIAVFVTAAASPVLARRMGRNAGWPLAGALLVCAALLGLAVSTGDSEQVFEWMPTLGVALALRVDGLSLLFGLLVLVIGAVVVAYSSRYLGAGRHRSFFGLMTLFAASMLLLVVADDVVLLFLAWEITTLCSFFLIARSGEGAREPAIRTLLVTVLGGLALLAAVVMMAVGAGSTRLSVILAHGMWDDNAPFTVTVAVLLAVAAFTKSAQFPFQAWLPDSMVAITPVSAYLHAAAMVKAGIYLLFRFSPVLADVPVWQYLLVSAGLITALFGSVAALRRYDLKELLAYSTISQLGLLVAMIGVGTPAALVAAAAHTIAHALFKSALFMVVGVIDRQVGTRDIRYLSGLRSRMPVTATLMVLSAASMAAIPPTLGFVSKESLLAAVWDASGPRWLAVALAVVIAVLAVFTVAYSARMVVGALTDAHTVRMGVVPVREASATMWLPVAVVSIAGVVLGFIPFVLNPLVDGAAAAASGGTVRVDLLLWHGVTPAFVLSLLVLAAGTVMVVARRRVNRLLAPLSSPISGLAVVEAVRTGTIRLGTWTGKPTATSFPRRHLMIPVMVLIVFAVVVTMAGLDLGPTVAGTSRMEDWGMLAIVVAGVAGTVVVRTRIAAIVVVGVVGFAVATWFFLLGAADVALTQLLVEILTLVVMVLLLKRLPRTFKREPRRGSVGPAFLALGAGAATTAGVFAFTGRRDMSAAGAYFATEGEGLTGGANVVNTILVDFRALDTLGELTVLGVAGIAIVALLRARREVESTEVEPTVDHTLPLADPHANSVFTRTLARLVGPLTVVLSLILLLRGHQEPGGGFIAALMGGAGFALVYLAAPTDKAARIRLPYVMLIGAGVLLATVTGFLGYVEGSFLTPLHVDVLGLHLTSTLLFDTGVYLAVIGVVLAALNLLGLPRRAPRVRRPDSAQADEVTRV